MGDFADREDIGFGAGAVRTAHEGIHTGTGSRRGSGHRREGVGDGQTTAGERAGRVQPGKRRNSGGTESVNQTPFALT